MLHSHFIDIFPLKVSLPWSKLTSPRPSWWAMVNICLFSANLFDMKNIGVATPTLQEWINMYEDWSATTTMQKFALWDILGSQALHVYSMINSWVKWNETHVLYSLTYKWVGSQFHSMLILEKRSHHQYKPLDWIRPIRFALI